jgi:hypothetical protein
MWELLELLGGLLNVIAEMQKMSWRERAVVLAFTIGIIVVILAITLRAFSESPVKPLLWVAGQPPLAVLGLKPPKKVG